MIVRPMTPEDWTGVLTVYAAGMTPAATFTHTLPDYAAWNAAHYPESRLVAEEGGEIEGFCALSPSFPNSEAYRGLVEVSLYVAPQARRKGIGRALLTAAAVAAREAGDHALFSKIFSDNQASLALHAACGFRTVGTLTRAGQDIEGRWRAVVLMEQPLLPREEGTAVSAE